MKSSQFHDLVYILCLFRLFEMYSKAYLGVDMQVKSVDMRSKRVLGARLIEQPGQHYRDIPF